MMYPGTYGGEGKEAGFAAIRKEHGEEMVQRVKNWPELQKRWLMAQGYAEDDPILLGELEQTRRNVERVRTDRDYAKNQAAMIARSIPKTEWGLVPSVAQLCRDYDLPGPPKGAALTPQEAYDVLHTLELKARKHYEDNMDMTPEAAAERAGRLIAGITKDIP
jgi:hypothetical protein